MRKQLGIIRNKIDRLANIKKESLRKKNRFHIVGKQEDYNQRSITTTTHSQHKSISEFSGKSIGEDVDESSKAVPLFQEARAKIKRTSQIQKKIADLSKARLSSLRQKQNQKYDQNIAKLANQATQCLLSAQGFLKKIAVIQPNSQTQKKILKSIEASLAGQIQTASRNMRLQQQQYFKRIKSYEGSTINSAIQLTAQQKKAMQVQWQVVEQKKQQKGNIGELVGSITRLSTLYKELNQLVVTQGSVIDRIDYNLQQTQQHIEKGIVHLKGAQQAATSVFADKVIKVLALSIILLAIILGLKYMK